MNIKDTSVLNFPMNKKWEWYNNANINNEDYYVAPIQGIKKRNTLKGSIVGALAGFGLGVIYGSTLEEGWLYSKNNNQMIGGILGFLTGALVGAIIGYYI